MEVTKKMNSMKPAEWAMLILLSIFWGGSFFFVEIALHDFQPLTIVFFRVLLAALTLFCVIHLRGQRLPASPGIWGAYFVMGALNNAIPFFRLQRNGVYIPGTGSH